MAERSVPTDISQEARTEVQIENQLSSSNQALRENQQSLPPRKIRTREWVRSQWYVYLLSEYQYESSGPVASNATQTTTGPALLDSSTGPIANVVPCSTSAFPRPSVRFIVRKQKLYYERDTSPLVDVEMGDGLPDPAELCEAVAVLYEILRYRREPWHKIKAIPADIAAPALIKQTIGETLQAVRDVERAEIFRQLFPEVTWNHERMGVRDQQNRLRFAGYAKHPLAELKVRRRARRSDASDFEREEAISLTPVNATAQPNIADVPVIQVTSASGTSPACAGNIAMLNTARLLRVLPVNASLT